MEQEVESKRRGPERSEKARIAILTAVAERLLASGYDSLTMEGIAADAGVGKQTIYRWWKTKGDLVADSLVEGFLIPDVFSPKNTGDIRADLTNWLKTIAKFLKTDTNSELLRSLVIASVNNPEVGENMYNRLGVIAMFNERFRAAIASGELPADTQVMEIGDALFGSIVLRVLRHGKIDETFITQIVNLLLPK
ncbi:MAG: TetR/AcrR family transcriptional regulator [Microbacteriaceae bacterium]|nr:TetR/AcrR family transcriptional regulator [Microbacteriaceae bacterium]